MPTSARMRRVANEHVRQTVDGSSVRRASEEWGFLCECGDPGCEALVRLRIGVFDALVRDGEEGVLAPGHEIQGARRAHGNDNGAQAIRFRAELLHAELMDAAEDIGRLLGDLEELELSPAARGLLFALDEALTAGFRRQ